MLPLQLAKALPRARLEGVEQHERRQRAARFQRFADCLGAVGAYRSLARHTQLGGVLTVFALP